MNDDRPRRARRRWMLLGLLIAALAFAPFALATHVTPTFVEGPTNHTCSEFQADGEAWLELKVDPPEDGTYASADAAVNVTVDIDAAGKVFSWSADGAVVSAVFVKAGSKGHYLYEYDPPSDGDTGLTSPGNGNQVSHISFCYVPADEPTCAEEPEMPECQPPTCDEQPEMPECQPPTCEEQPDMPECQPPTCEEQPEMPECQPPTCDEQPEMPECQPPTCDEQPEMPECQPPTCEEQPEMPECQPPTCDEQPDMPECQPPTCADQPDMPGCEVDVCLGIGIMAMANGDGSITVDVDSETGFALFRVMDGEAPVLLGDFEGDARFVDTDVDGGATVTYQAVTDGVVCATVEVTSIPDFPTTIGLAAAGTLGMLAYAWTRRRK